VARGAAVTIDILRWDEVDLSIEARLLEVAAAPAGDVALDDEESDEDESVAAVAAEAEGVADLTPVGVDAAAPAEEPGSEAPPLSN
jgi:exoribonuclease-2